MPKLLQDFELQLYKCEYLLLFLISISEANSPLKIIRELMGVSIVLLV